MIGKFSELLNLTIPLGQLDEYFDMLVRERARAWRKYDMLMMTGLEFNKEGFTRKTSGLLRRLSRPANHVGTPSVAACSIPSPSKCHN